MDFRFARSARGPLLLMLAAIGLPIANVPAMQGDGDHGAGAPAGPARNGSGRTPAIDEKLIVAVRVQSPFELGKKQHPIAGIKLEAGYQPQGSDAPVVLASGVTDAAGGAELQVDWSVILPTQHPRAAWFWLRAKGDGFRDAVVRKVMPEHPGRFDLKLEITKGATLRGRLLNSLGEPVQGTVRARQPGQGDSTCRTVPSSSAWSAQETTQFSPARR